MTKLVLVKNKMILSLPKVDIKYNSKNLTNFTLFAGSMLWVTDPCFSLQFRAHAFHALAIKSRGKNLVSESYCIYRAD